MSLAYIDKEFEYAEVQTRVQSMVLEEMRAIQTTKNHYLSHLPPVPAPFPSNPRLQEEYARVSARVALDAVDVSKFSVARPTSATDPQDWERSILNAKSQMEHQANRMLNLEVAEAKAPAVWLHYNAKLESVQAALAEELKQVQEEQNRINLKRKTGQEHIVEELVRNKFQRQEILLKCWEICKSCAVLEQAARSKD